MSRPIYTWRKLTAEQRTDLLQWRKGHSLPWHRPPHRASNHTRYHLTAACFEHQHFVGHSRERMESFCNTLLGVLTKQGAHVHAWCVLPNHYHALIETSAIPDLLSELGRMHGRLSFEWNGEEQARGRQVWCGVADRYIRNDRHFWATMNYVHNNPVHHGYAEHWQEWPYSSATEYLERIGRDDAARLWNEYPILDYGKGWDAPEL